MVKGKETQVGASNQAECGYSMRSSVGLNTISVFAFEYIYSRYCEQAIKSNDQENCCRHAYANLRKNAEKEIKM